MKKITIVILMLFMCACVGGKSRPSQFYQFKSVDTSAPAVSNKRFSIGIEQVNIPPYLDRPQIVTVRSDSMELDFSEFNRWAEPLSSSLPRVLADDLSSYLPKSLIKVRRSITEPFVYSLIVEINKFDAILENNAELDAWWTIYKDNKIVARQRSKLNVNVGKTYDELVESQGMLIGELAKEIAEKITKL